MKGPKRPINAVATWVRRQPPKVKAFLAVISAMAALVFLRLVVEDHGNLFVAAEGVNAIGISVLIYKLTKEKSCAGVGILRFPKICWAFCVYVEAVSILPQLRVMQNAKIVEPFAAHYVFALGVARFLSCVHWVLQVVDTRGQLLTALGYGLWPPMVLLSEIIQTFILADFCYYYVKSLVGGQLALRLPSGVV